MMVWMLIVAVRNIVVDRKKFVCCLHKKRQETIRNRNLDDVSMEDLIKEVQEHGKCKCYIFFYLFQTIGYLFTKVKSFPPNKK